MPDDSLAPDEICPCADCPDRTEPSCMCDIDHEKETADCRNCYFRDDCETEKDKRRKTWNCRH